ncbi:GGDEF domain-containing protein [Neobacillus muris]|uniref:GGDEF domain-containing protein n=1 Tax=Neobacillus muris TaxID=2941334 RepID=UPI00204107E8|nr:diguanylate cyclase response regulator [Neobacillus muris]
MGVNSSSALYQSYSGISVLYVEDELFSREKILRVLGRRFRNVYASLDGEEGLELYQKYQPDLLIIDIHFNHPSELEMIEAIRKLNDQIPIIITAAEDEQEVYQPLLENGIVNHVIPKPIHLERFLQAVQQSVIQIEAIRELEKYKMQQLSLFDPLTNTLKRGRFNEILDDMVTKAEKWDQTFSLMVMDLDDLKRINSRFSHKAGDHLLKTFSTIVQQQIGESDVFARWGGDCFILLLPKTEMKDALEMAESIQTILVNFSFRELGKVTCSFGIAAYTSGMSKRDLLFRAEHALYESKQSGKNCITFFSPESTSFKRK